MNRESVFGRRRKPKLAERLEPWPPSSSLSCTGGFKKRGLRDSLTANPLKGNTMQVPRLQSSDPQAQQDERISEAGAAGEKPQVLRDGELDSVVGGEIVIPPRSNWTLEEREMYADIAKANNRDPEGTDTGIFHMVSVGIYGMEATAERLHR
jgi:hypothetical protein